MPAYRWFAEGKRQRFYARNGLKTTLEPWKPPAVPTRNRVWMLICQGAGFSWVFALACIISFECGRFDLVAGCARQLQWPPIEMVAGAADEDMMTWKFPAASKLA